MQEPNPHVLTEAKAAVAPTESVGIEELYRQYARYVAKIGYRLLGDHDMVEDLVQDVFLAAHRGADKLREPAAVRGWLATVTVRTARRRLRKRKLFAFFQIDLELGYENIASQDATPEQRAQVAAVYRSLDALSVNERLAWTLRHLEGEQLTRVAELCECSLATAKRRIKSAQDAVRREVCDE